MASEWTLHKVGDICKTVSVTHRFNKDELIFLNTGDIEKGKFLHRDYTQVADMPGQAKKTIRKYDILLSEIRPANGRWAFVDFDADDYVVSTKLMVIRAEQNVLPKYLYYYLTSPDVVKWLQHLAESRSGTFPQITFSQVAEMDIQLPPLEKQAEIVTFIDSLNDKIANNEAINKTAEDMAQAVFKEWFVSQREDNWKTIRLGDLINIRGGLAYKREHIGEGDAILLGMGCVSNKERFLFSGARSYSSEFGDKHIVKPGDIIVATRQQSDNLPILGYPARIPDFLENKKIIVGTNLYKITNSSILHNSIVFQLLKADEYKRHILANSKGTTVRMITKDSIEDFEFKMPPRALIEKTESVLTVLDKEINANIEQIESLKSIRENILPKLMTGELSVNE